MTAARSFPAVLMLTAVTLISVFIPAPAQAERFKIVVMKDQAGGDERFRSVTEYLATKGLEVSFLIAKDHSTAIYSFATGDADVMFIDPGIAAIFLLKELASPLVCTIDRSGKRLERAVVIGPRNAPKFSGSADSFRGKKVIFVNLSISGELYFRSLAGALQSNVTQLSVNSHREALEALSRGQADFAIVKNRVWDEAAVGYNGLAKIGGDQNGSPEMTVIASRLVPAELAEKVVAALVSVADDPSPVARSVLNDLEIRGFARTTRADFKHALELLARMGATRKFDFSYY